MPPVVRFAVAIYKLLACTRTQSLSIGPGKVMSVIANMVIIYSDGTYGQYNLYVDAQEPESLAEITYSAPTTKIML